MTILATTAALKYCALATAACFAGYLVSARLYRWAVYGSAIEWLAKWYVRFFNAGIVLGLAALPLLAIANLLRVWGVL